MKSAAGEPKVRVLSAERLGDRCRVVCRFSEPCSDPIAPGALYERPGSGDAFFPLHRIVHRDDWTLTFETFSLERPVPPTEKDFFYRAWWLPAAMSAALDSKAEWRRSVYPDDGTHEHCLFSWETISAYTGERVGYHSRAHGWITERSFRDHIAGDIFRLRGGA